MMADNTDVNSAADSGSSSPQYARLSLHTRRIKISRPVYDQASFDRKFGVGPSTTLRERLQSLLPPSCDRSTPRRVCRRLVRYLPVVAHLRNYRWKAWLLRDVIAGISSGVIHVPQGMGFALLAGVPPVYGLYSSVFPGWVYYLFGTSRHLSVGAMALTALMVGAVVARIVPGVQADVGQQNVESTSGTSLRMPTRTTTDLALMSRDVTSSYDDVTSPVLSDDYAAMKVGVAVSVTLIAGLFQLAMRICRLGVITTYMSKPFIEAFLTASATQIIVAQIPFELGLAIQRPLGYFVVPLTIVEVFRHIVETNICALIVSVISIAFLVTIKEYINVRFKSKLKIPIPAELLLIILATVVSYFGGLHERYALPVIGQIPLGLPAPSVPPMTAAGSYVVDGMVIGVVGFVVAVTMARLMAERNSYEVDSDQELLACSLYNTTGAFFGCFVATQAPPRTLVHETAGGRTQMAGALSTVVPLLVVLAIGPLFEALPISVLGCVTSCAILPLMKQFVRLKPLWRVSLFDLVTWIMTYVVTTFVGVTVGLAVGMALTCLLAVVQTQRARGRRLTRAADTEIYYHQSRPTTTSYATIPAGVVVYRVGGPVFFANADKFVDQLYSDVLRPTCSIQPSVAYIVVSDDHHEFAGDSQRATTQNDVEMNELRCTNGPAAGLRDVQSTTTTSEAHETPDLNDNTEDSGVMTPQNFASDTVRVIVLDFSKVTFMDSTAVEALKKVYAAYRQVGVQVIFSGCEARVTAVMTAARLADDIQGHIELYPTAHDAVMAVS